MKDGFLNVSCRTLPISVADCERNGLLAATAVNEAAENGVQILCLQELGLTGASCGDLFLQNALLEGALAALRNFLAATAEAETLAAVGLPLLVEDKVYDCAAVCQMGRILGIVPKTYAIAPFAPAPEGVRDITVLDSLVPFGAELLFACGEAVIGVEVGTDRNAPVPPSAFLAQAGANVVLNPSAEPVLVGCEAKRRKAVESQSARLHTAYLSAFAGATESTTDFVFGGRNLIVENGHVLAEGETAKTEIDLQLLYARRRADAWFTAQEDAVRVEFSLSRRQVELTREYDLYPFCSGDEAVCSEILSVQAMGLARRAEAARAETLVLGLSGGLDSTLALLVAVRALEVMQRPATDLLAVSMPCFGTTDRTKNNAQKLAEALGVRFREIPIGAAVEQHFQDIGLPSGDRSATYENAQARERTQVLMDLAGLEGGIVIGTGDLSELALGWCTYNGDHMSMYAVNASVTKTLAQNLVSYVERTCGDASVGAILEDILETPISPELLPPSEGKIAQKTEDLVGPYELHDFFLYHLLKNGFAPRKIYRIACHAWTWMYEDSVILHWLKTFCRRFFTQQFKRSCLPDGPAVGTVSLSPRAAWHMPSDAVGSLWLKELDEI